MNKNEFNRRQKAREEHLQSLTLKISRRDWRTAREEIGLEKADAEHDEYVNFIMLAHKASGKPFTELDEMGFDALMNTVFPADLVPTAEELAVAGEQ